MNNAEILATRRPLAIQGHFMWSCGDSDGPWRPSELPPDWCFSPAFRGGSFRTIYDTEEAAMTALRAGYARMVTAGEA